MAKQQPKPADDGNTNTEVTQLASARYSKRKGPPVEEPHFQDEDDTEHGFKAHHKEQFHDHAEGGGHGGTEMGWLVSYADMMTLLFGLFVILFSITTDKSKNVNDVMMEVSKKYFSNQDGEEFTPSAALPASEKAPEEPVKDPSKDIENAQATFDAEKQQYEKKIDELKAEVEKLEQEKTEAQKEKKTAQKKLAAVDNPTTDIKKEIEQLEVKLADKTKDFDKLQDEINKKTEENKKLQDELYKNKSTAKNYMMVLVTWETEKHDIDLEITTPTQKHFNFKKRKVANEPGAFELDSRFGPGIEMWKAEAFQPGAYQSKISLYNKNGNDAPAKIQLTVVTNLSTYKSDPIELDSAHKEVNVPFTITADGSVEFSK
jgi:flagellar motor protein MotB